MARTTVGVIGLGMAVPPHAQSLIELADRLQVAGCYAPDPQRRDRFHERFGLPVTDDLDGLIGDPSIDALLILTPPATHLDLARRAAAAGKHVLVEKPLEVTAARARALIDAVEGAGLTLAVMFQHRFRAVSRRLAGVVAEGRLGPLLLASASIPWWRPDSYFTPTEPGGPSRGTIARDGGGVLLTQGVHTLDLLLSLTGPADEVQAYAVTSPLRAIDTEDVVAASVRFASGAVGTIEATNTARPGWPELITLVGERGTARLASDRLSVELADGTRIEEGSDEGGGGGADPMAFSHDAHKAAIEDFLAALETGGRPATHGASSFLVHALIEAILASAAAHAPVRVARL